MKLSELTGIFLEIKKFLAKENAEQLKKALTNDLAELGKSIPPRIDDILKQYQNSYEVLSPVYKQIEPIINEAVQQGKIIFTQLAEGEVGVSKVVSDDEIDFPLSNDFVKAYLLLRFHYANFLMEKEKFIRDVKSPNQLCIDEKKQRFVFIDEDFSRDFIKDYKKNIQTILEIFSKKFDQEEFSTLLQSHGQDVLEASSINHGFYTDGYNSFFEGQTVPHFSRGTTRKLVENKVDDFVNHYLEASKFSDNIKPNLKGLLTTLTYQSGLPGLASEMSIGFVSFNYDDSVKGKGNTYVAGGNDAHFHVSFDKKFNLKIKFFCQQERQGILIGGYINFPFTRSISLKIGVGVDKDNIPSFNLKKFKFSYAGSVAEPGFNVTFLKEALNNSKKIPDNHIDIFRGFIDHLSKFAGYGSAGDMDFRLGRAKTREEADKMAKIQLEFDPQLFKELTKKNDQDQGLSVEEANFLTKIYTEFHEKKATRKKLSEMICEFVSKKLSKLSDDDKLRYIALIKMAIDLGGSELKAVQTVCEEFVSSLKSNKEYLFKAMKSDMAIREAYRRKAQGIFSGLPAFSKDEFIVIMCVLEKEHLEILIKQPGILQHYGDGRYHSFLESLSAEKKVIFLIDYVLRNGVKALSYLTENCFPTTEQYVVGAQLKNHLLPEVHAALGKLIMQSNVAEFDAIKDQLSGLLNDYAFSWPNSFKSIRQRVAMLADENSVLERFGDIFIANTLNDLKTYLKEHTKVSSLLDIQKIVALFQEGVIPKILSKEGKKQWNSDIREIQTLLNNKLEEIENIKAKQKQEKPSISSEEDALVKSLSEVDEKLGDTLSKLDEKKREKEQSKVISPTVLPSVFKDVTTVTAKVTTTTTKSVEDKTNTNEPEKPKNF